MILGNILKLFLAIIFGVQMFREFEVLGKLEKGMANHFTIHYAK